MNHEIFVCYNQKDQDFVKELVARLSDKGWKLWLWAEYEKQRGKKPETAILEAIQHARASLCCYGPHGLGSFQEWELMCCEKNTDTIPVLLPGWESRAHELPLFSSLSRVEFQHSPWEDSFQKLEELLRDADAETRERDMVWFHLDLDRTEFRATALAACQRLVEKDLAVQEPQLLRIQDSSRVTLGCGEDRVSLTREGYRTFQAQTLVSAEDPWIGRGATPQWPFIADCHRLALEAEATRTLLQRSMRSRYRELTGEQLADSWLRVALEDVMRALASSPQSSANSVIDKILTNIEAKQLEGKELVGAGPASPPEPATRLEEAGLSEKEKLALTIWWGYKTSSSPDPRRQLAKEYGIPEERVGTLREEGWTIINRIMNRD